MSEATYVSFVPKDRREKLRRILQTEDTGPITWRERKTFSGSEFFFSGPAQLVRKTHAYISQWLAAG